jgi:hypothetical protein
MKKIIHFSQKLAVFIERESCAALNMWLILFLLLLMKNML